MKLYIVLFDNINGKSFVINAPELRVSKASFFEEIGCHAKLLSKSDLACYLRVLSLVWPINRLSNKKLPLMQRVITCICGVNLKSFALEIYKLQTAFQYCI